MARAKPPKHALKVSELSQSAPTPFSLQPDPSELLALAGALDLSSLRKVRLEGEIATSGTSDWVLTARLGATVVQPCVVTLEPVTTRIDTDVSRLYLSVYDIPDEPEAEMPEDETVEKLGAWIDLAAVLKEALALAVPDYPRKDGAELGEAVYTEPGEAPMTDVDAKPFASLADFKAKLEKGSD